MTSRETGRRSNEQRGFVNFPTESKEFRNSGEGGMFVFLVVVEPSEIDFDNRWPVCCTNSVVIPLGDGVVGDDQLPEPPLVDYTKIGSKEEMSAAMKAEEANHPSLFHYPHCYDNREPDETDEGFFKRVDNSIPYLAAIMLGSTGWSGWCDRSGNGNWRCTLEDLSEEGRALYELVEKLYGDRGELHLVTYLDT